MCSFTNSVCISDLALVLQCIIALVLCISIVPNEFHHRIQFICCTDTTSCIDARTYTLTWTVTQLVWVEWNCEAHNIHAHTSLQSLLAPWHVFQLSSVFPRPLIKHRSKMAKQTYHCTHSHVGFAVILCACAWSWRSHESLSLLVPFLCSYWCESVCNGRP